MPKVYSLDRHESVRNVYSATKSIRKTARLLDVGKSTVHRWICEDVQYETTEQSSIDADVDSKLERILCFVKSTIVADPFQTCIRIKQLVADNLTIDVSKELVRLAIKKLGYSKKKARYFGVAKNALILNRRFLRKRDAYIANGNPIFSVDETGFGRFSYARTHGYAPKGQPLYIRKEAARMTSVTALACASTDGWVDIKLLKGASNRERFCEFLRNLDLPVGAVIMLDNASIHKGDEVYKVCTSKGLNLLFVPPYSPWYNPIEKCFSIVKRAFPQIQDIKESFHCVKSDAHFKPFFKATLACNGFNAEDAENNTMPLTPDELENERVYEEQKLNGLMNRVTRPKPKTTVDVVTSTIKSRDEIGQLSVTKTIRTTTTVYINDVVIKQTVSEVHETRKRKQHSQIVEHKDTTTLIEA
jgi:transposase